MIGWVFEDLLYDVICYWIGYVFLRIVTLGRFPNQAQSEKFKRRIKFTGVLVLVAGLTTVGFVSS